MAGREPKKRSPKKRKTGPKGGLKHTPGKDHNVKSGDAKKKRFVKKQRQLREMRRAEAKRQWEIWDGLTDEQKRLREDLRPTLPRPTDGD